MQIGSDIMGPECQGIARYLDVKYLCVGKYWLDYKIYVLTLPTLTLENI